MLEFNKDTGPKPSKAVLTEASKLAREGSGDFLAIAMAMRPNGVTQKEIVTVLGNPHRNVIKKLVVGKKVKQVELPDGSRSKRVKLLRR